MSHDINLKAKRTAIFITGAGSGFGRACALSAAAMFRNDSLLLICGRNLDNLKETAILVKEENETIMVESFQLDLETVKYEEMKLILTRVLKINSKPFDCFVIIHNAGSIGDTSKCSYELMDRVAIESFMNVNVNGTVIVNTALLEHIALMGAHSGPLVLVVNISSLAAIESFPSCSLYCTAKAAREMFFRCLSTEWAQFRVDTAVKRRLFVINYAPGPMDTAMVSLLLNAAPSSAFIDSMRAMRDGQRMVQPRVSADKLFGQILANYTAFQSGSRMDYFDEPR